MADSTPPAPRGKPATRRTLLSRRDGLTADERTAASTTITTAALQLLAAHLPAGAVVGLYAAKGSEVATAALDVALRDAGFTTAYPRIVETSRLLAFHRASIAELAPSRFGIHEPSADAPIAELGSITAFVIPGVAFDLRGGRLGWGRGYYDATLTAAPTALRIGLAFACQLVDHVPHEAHDVSLHHIITEAATHTVA